MSYITTIVMKITMWLSSLLLSPSMHTANQYLKILFSKIYILFCMILTYDVISLLWRRSVYDIDDVADFAVHVAVKGIDGRII